MMKLCRVFYDGLKRQIKFGLLTMPKAKNLQELIQNSLNYETRWLETHLNSSGPQLSNIYNSNTGSGPSRPAQDPNAMDIDASRMSPEEQQRHYKQGLCFNCHKTGHISRDCPEKKKTGRPSKAQVAATTEDELVLDKEAEMEKEVQK